MSSFIEHHEGDGSAYHGGGNIVEKGADGERSLPTGAKPLSSRRVGILARFWGVCDSSRWQARMAKPSNSPSRFSSTRHSPSAPCPPGRCWAREKSWSGVFARHHYGGEPHQRHPWCSGVANGFPSRMTAKSINSSGRRPGSACYCRWPGLERK